MLEIFPRAWGGEERGSVVVCQNTAEPVDGLHPCNQNGDSAGPAERWQPTDRRALRQCNPGGRKDHLMTHRIRVTAVRKDHPDLERFVAVLLSLALARAEAEAATKSKTDRADAPPEEAA